MVLDKLGLSLARLAAKTKLAPNLEISFVPQPLSAQALSLAAKSWFAIAAAGQVIFFAYQALFYGPTALSGDYAQWARNDNLIDGYTAGDGLGNLGFLSHVLLGAAITALGILQLIPAVRRRFPQAHRWCGRAFLVLSIAAAIGGLALVWLRGTQTTIVAALGISLNGILILAFAAAAWRAALRRDIAAHERLAFCLWLCVSGVWFLRVGMAAFGIITFGLLRLKEPPFALAFSIWSFGSYLAPLAIYALYRAAKSGPAPVRAAMAGLLFFLCLLTAGGVAGMTIGQWGPLILAPPV